MPVRSRPERIDIVVAALSARALARSARRAGLRALAIDLFADADTREHAAVAVRAPASRRGMGFDGPALLAALAEHAPGGAPVVFGAGFEHAPRLMRAIARRNPIVGAAPDTVALLKDPHRLAALLGELRIPHPAMVDAATAEALSKRVGGSGGAHIRPAPAASDTLPDRRTSRRYLQAFVSGRPVSALFLADGRSVRIVGYSEQWTDPAPRAPFRYGGAVGPIELPTALAAEIEAALGRLVASTGLTGLASADLILPDDGAFVLLEINPRPGATLDVFDRGATPPLLGLHLDAAAGRLPAAPPAFSTAEAAAVVYAPRAVRPCASLPRPVWTADWPSCDETVPAGAPFCTVFAAGPTPSAARALLAERRDALITSLRLLPAARDHKNIEKAPA